MKNFINSYDRVKGAIESGKAINIFNMVDGDYVGMGEFEYSDEAMIVLELGRQEWRRIRRRHLQSCSRINKCRQGYHVVRKTALVHRFRGE